MISPFIMPRMPLPPISAGNIKEVEKGNLKKEVSRFEFRPTQDDPDIMKILSEGMTLSGYKAAPFTRLAVRVATDRLKKGLPITGIENGKSQFEGGPLLDVRVACGPLEEARDNASKLFTISKAVADEIGFRKDSSFFARTRGESMEGAGIPNEAIVCFLPLMMDKEPQDNRQIALVAFHDESGAILGGTVKRWMRNEKGELELRNGKGEIVPFPPGTANVRAVAIATGVVGGL